MALKSSSPAANGRRLPNVRRTQRCATSWQGDPDGSRTPPSKTTDHPLERQRGRSRTLELREDWPEVPENLRPVLCVKKAAGYFAQELLQVPSHEGLARLLEEGARKLRDAEIAPRAGLGRNPRKRVGIVADRQEKTPTENGWGFVIGGGGGN